VLGQADQPVTDPAAFYQHPITNHYSRILHQSMADGRVYGFPFDDVGQTASYIEDHHPSTIEITLTPFGAGTSGAGGLPNGVPEPVVTATSSATATRAGFADQPRKGTRSAYSEIPADGFTAQSGIRTQSSTEGGRNIGYISNGDWVCYSAVDFGSKTPATQFLVRAASGAATGVSGFVEVRLDKMTNTPVGTIAVANTGGWQAWRTIPGNMAPVTGVHNVYLTFTSAQPAEYINIRWLTFGH
jgi:hypothetical protein